MFLNRLNTSLRIKFAILFLTVLCIVFMIPRGGSIESEIVSGSIWMQDDLIADFSFPVLKNTEQYNQEIKAEKKAVLPIFLYNEKIPLRTIDSINNFHNNFLNSLQLLGASGTTNDRTLSFFSAHAIGTAKNLFQKEHSKGSSKPSLSTLKKAVIERVKEFYKDGVIGPYPREFKVDTIAIRKKNIDIIESIHKFSKLEDLVATVSRNSETPGNNPFTELVDEYAIHFIAANIYFDASLTKEEFDYSIKKVPRYVGIVNENEKIVGKHDRITPDIKLRIDSYRIAKGESIGWEGTLLQGVGKFLHIFLLVLLFSIYIFLFRKKIYNDNRKLLVFAILLVWTCFITYLENFIPVSDAIRFLIFIPAAAMLITIMFDSRVGFYSTVVFSLICGALRGNDYTFVVMNIVAGALSAYSVRDIKNRSQIFRSFLFILAAYIVSIFAFGLERFAPWQKMLVEIAFASTNALISPVLTYGLLVFFEQIFKITTDLTLLELSNFDRPLLRELAKKAPGSFNHSLTLGTLAENAATAVHANSLMARVGSYYHDIGKIGSPKFFVENQGESNNIHNEIVPEESAKALRDHVFRGIELAKQYQLPQEIIDFIPMHHGTMTMNFFYEKAKRFYGEENIDIKTYRYPGPKPNTKETAIVMLADSCESAVRSIQNPDAEKVENVINNLVNNRIEDGQLDESPLTFGDIIKIKESFYEILIGQNHKRIQYPHQDKLEKAD